MLDADLTNESKEVYIQLNHQKTVSCYRRVHECNKRLKNKKLLKKLRSALYKDTLHAWKRRSLSSPFRGFFDSQDNSFSNEK